VLAFAFGAYAVADGPASLKDPGVIVGQVSHPYTLVAVMIASLLTVFSISRPRMGKRRYMQPRRRATPLACPAGGIVSPRRKGRLSVASTPLPAGRRRLFGLAVF
jgi:hypothetical protein